MILSQPQRVITRLMVTLSVYLSISLLLHFFFFGLGLSQQNDNGGNREYHYERLAHRVVTSEVKDYGGDVVHGVGLCKVLLDYRGGRAVSLLRTFAMLFGALMILLIFGSSLIALGIA